MRRMPRKWVKCTRCKHLRGYYCTRFEKHVIPEIPRLCKGFGK